jgi:hypothetical protein
VERALAEDLAQVSSPLSPDAYVPVVAGFAGVAELAEPQTLYSAARRSTEKRTT